MREQFTTYLVTERNLTTMTAWTYNKSLDRLERYLGKLASEMTVADAREFLRSDYGPATKSSSVYALKAFHKWGALEGLWSLNGIMAISCPKVIHNPRPSLTRPEATQLLSSVRTPVEYRLVYFGLYAGTRVSESASIDNSCWLEDRLRFIGKGRKVREVPVHPELVKMKDLILSRNPSPATLKQQAYSLAAVVRFSFTSHSLRRTFAVTLSEHGRVSRDVIGALLGHRASVTEMYTPVRFDELQDAIGKLSYQ